MEFLLYIIRQRRFSFQVSWCQMMTAVQQKADASKAICFFFNISRKKKTCSFWKCCCFLNCKHFKLILQDNFQKMLQSVIYLSHHFIVTIALSENLRHIMLWIQIFLSAKISATFKKENDSIEAKYLIFQRINGKVLSDWNQHFSSDPSDRATLKFSTIKAWTKRIGKVLIAS